MFRGAEGCLMKTTEVNIMAFILSMYATILTLAIWQEVHSENDMHNAISA